MNRQETINKLRDLADYNEEETGNVNVAELLREIADDLQVTPNPIQDIVKLNEERYGLTFEPYNEYKKLKEEYNEFLEAIFNDDIHEMIDALNDIIVVAIGAIRKIGHNPECTLNEVVKEISSRKQDPAQKHRWERLFKKQPGEKWLKDKWQDPESLYKADFSKCKIENNNEDN